MDALTSLKNKLKPLNLYRLAEGSVVCAELEAYAVGLGFINDAIEELERECFVLSSSTFGLSLRENLFGYARSSLAVEHRRRMLMSRFAVPSDGLTKTDIELAMVGCGMEVEIFEKPGKDNFDLHCLKIFDRTVTNTEAADVAEEFLPAHLIVNFDFGSLSWSLIDQSERTFQEMDDKDLTWNEIDVV